MYVEGHEIVQAVRGFLIDEVQPVMIEKVGIAAPYEARAFLRIIVGIIVGRKHFTVCIYIHSCTFGLGQ